MFNGRRQPSRGGTSRMMREYQVRFCERLGVKFPGPTRQKPALPRRSIAVRFTSMTRPWQGKLALRVRAKRRLMHRSKQGVIQLPRRHAVAKEKAHPGRAPLRYV